MVEHEKNTKYSIFPHANENCMSYIEHAKLSLNLSSKLFIGSAKALIHAFIPNLYKTSSSDVVGELQNIINNAGCHKIKD